EPYDVFPDVFDFLEYIKKYQIKLGVITNDSERYRDTILPILGKLNVFLFYLFIYCIPISIQLLFFFFDWFEKIYVYFEFVADNKSACAKKLDPKMLKYAKRDGGFELNEWWVYIGDNYNKDILPMKTLGGNLIKSI
ncbi:hypothetical protein RFI_32429, partial [Reticulomyxa filosa]